MATTRQPTVGAIGLMPMPGPVGWLIRAGQWLNGDGFSNSEHAVVCISVDAAGRALVVQAMPGGANVRWLPPDTGIVWSAMPLTGWQRTAISFAALRYVGTPYSALDYLALAARRLRIPAPGLRRYITSTRHMICSQLADQTYVDAGVHLFADGRWPGYVTPGALRQLFESHP